MASRKKTARSDNGRARRATPRGGEDALLLGAGRQLPPLAFVTQRENLIEDVGRDAVDEFLGAVEAGHRLIELTAAEARSADAAARRVRRELQGGQRPRGVVLLGGYDVVPAAAVDCLPPRLDRRLGSERDQEYDEFIVWSDDIYGDLQDDWLPELPVSRIPDGRSHRLMRRALSAGPAANAPEPRRGLRNVKRPFADGIFRTLPGTKSLLRSQPTQANQMPAYSLDGERVYLVLHGDDTDATGFWGENEAGLLLAMEVNDVPARRGTVVLAGCCWGALIVRPKAVDVERRTIPVDRTPGSSIALQFLLEGAWAFVGCTGAHWSPVDAPYQYNAGPLHQEFWRLYNAGTPPAEALFLAKLDYQRRIPHRRRRDAWEEACEFKTLRQHTCLGLGW